MKVAKVIPVHKKDDTHVIGNYRPISVLPFFSKILEKIVYNRLEHFLTKHAILNPCQYGFTRNVSTEMALVDLHNYLISSLNDKLHSVGVFLDLSKAFDSINHEIMFKKMKVYGIRGTVSLWFENYLKNRTQITFYSDVLSDPMRVTCGVPQGSILGPILFLLYINDLINCSDKLKFILFADDTNILYSHDNFYDLCKFLNEELCNVSQWFNYNKLSLNTSQI